MDLLILINDYGGIESIYKSILIFSGAFVFTYILIKLASLILKIFIPILFIALIFLIANIYGYNIIINYDISNFYYNIEIFINYVYKFYIDITKASVIMSLIGIITGFLTALFYKGNK